MLTAVFLLLRMMFALQETGKLMRLVSLSRNLRRYNCRWKKNPIRNKKKTSQPVNPERLIR